MEPLVEAALKRRDETSAAEIRELCESGDNQLWVVLSGEGDVLAVVVTAIVVLPLKKVCSIRIGTGSERYRWQGYLDIIESWAKAAGCDRMKFPARLGWKPWLEARGYRQTHAIMEREL